VRSMLPMMIKAAMVGMLGVYISAAFFLRDKYDALRDLHPVAFAGVRAAVNGATAALGFWFNELWAVYVSRERKFVDMDKVIRAGIVGATVYAGIVLHGGYDFFVTKVLPDNGIVKLLGGWLFMPLVLCTPLAMIMQELFIDNRAFMRFLSPKNIATRPLRTLQYFGDSIARAAGIYARAFGERLFWFMNAVSWGVFGFAWLAPSMFGGGLTLWVMVSGVAWAVISPIMLNEWSQRVDDRAVDDPTRKAQSVSSSSIVRAADCAGWVFQIDSVVRTSRRQDDRESSSPLKSKKSTVNPILFADPRTHDVVLRELTARARKLSSKEFYEAYQPWELSAPFLSFSDKVYTHAMLAKLGLLKTVFGTKEVQYWLAEIKTSIPRAAYDELRKQVLAPGGFREIAAEHASRLSRAYMGKVMVRRDKGPVVELYGQPYLGDYELGRLADTVFLQRYLMAAHETGLNHKEDASVDVVLSDRLSENERVLFEKLDRSVLKIRGDSHVHVQSGASSDFVWLFSVGGIETDGYFSPAFMQALYPRSEHAPSETTIDWNMFSPDSYADLNRVVFRARMIRSMLIGELHLPRIVDDETLFAKAFVAYPELAEDYFLLKHVFLDHIQMRPHAAEGFDMTKFWQTYDISTVLFRQADRKHVMSEDDYAASIGLWTRQVIAENRKNRYLELRFQPKYSAQAFEKAIDAMVREIDVAKREYPENNVSIVAAFSRYPGEVGFSKSMTRAEMFFDLLRRRPDLARHFSGWDLQAGSIGAPPERYDELRAAFDKFSAETGIVLPASNHLSEGWGTEGDYAIDNITSMRYAQHEIADSRTHSVSHLTAVLMPFVGIAIERPVAVNKSELEKTVAWVSALATQGVQIDLVAMQETIDAALAKSDPAAADPIVSFERPFLSVDDQHRIAVHLMKQLVDRHVFLELNPSMNVLSNPEMGTFVDCHLVRLAAQDFRVDGIDFSALKKLIVIGTDVPGILGLKRGVKEEYVRLAQGMLARGMSVEKIIEVLSAFDANTLSRRRSSPDRDVGGIDLGRLQSMVTAPN